MKTLILLWLCVILAGVCKAVKDTLQFHYGNSIFSKLNPQYWNADVSWKNKYKEDLKTPKFWGSTTVFVMFTDAWHLFDMLNTLLLFFACFFTVLSDFKEWAICLSIFILFIVYHLIFELFYRIFAK